MPQNQTDHYNIFQRFTRWFVFSLVRLFYPRIEIRGRENLPAQGPVIFVLNHPNGLLDPMLLMAGLKWPVVFWAKSTLFGNPVGKFFCEAFGALPIYRKRDDGVRGGPRGDARERNEVIFAQSRKLLNQGGAMALFPEGVTHSESQMLQLRTGAARMALTTEAEAEWQSGLLIVPVGLWYEDKTLFRTSVLLVVGEPFSVSVYAEPYSTNAVQTVKNVTRQIEAGLDQVVLQAENADLLSAIPTLAAWTVPQNEGGSLADQHTWTEKLFATYDYLQQHDPARLDHIAKQAWQYAWTLEKLGIDDPWTLELPVANLWKIIRTVLLLFLTFPLALVGFILSYIPFRLAGPVAVLIIGRYDTQISTFKLIGGAIFVFISNIIEVIIVGLWFGWGWGLLLLLVVAPLSYLALLWGEQRRNLWQLLSNSWFRVRRTKLAQSLASQRQALNEQVLAAVRDVYLA